MDDTEFDCREGDGEEDSETLHPKVKEELDRLNQASENINKLENELDDARSKFSSTRNDSTQQLNALAHKIKTGVIKKARPYYEANEKARKAQEEALKAARQFQSANGIHRAAKETIGLAEQKLCQESGRVLTSEWQEMFNHATIRLMDAEKEKRRSEEEHHRKSQIFSEAEKHMQTEEKKHKRSISRARPYFERKAELQTKLELLKVAVEALQDAVTQSKRKYSEALSNLEAISNHVHEKRKVKLQLYLPREPGVGAETDTTDSQGAASLRTSFDVPDTPNSEPKSFDLETEGVDCDDDERNYDDTNSVESFDCSSDVFSLTLDTGSDNEQPTKSSDKGDKSFDRGMFLGNPVHLVVKSTKSLSSLESISEERPIVVGQCETIEVDSNCNKTEMPDVTKAEASSNRDYERAVVENGIVTSDRLITGYKQSVHCNNADHQHNLHPQAMDVSKVSSDINSESIVNQGDSEENSEGKCISKEEYPQTNENVSTGPAIIENTEEKLSEIQSDQTPDSNSGNTITALGASESDYVTDLFQSRVSDITLPACIDTIALEEIVPQIRPNLTKASGKNIKSEDNVTESLQPSKSEAEVFV